MDWEKKLTELLKEAMKAGDKKRLMAVRSLKAVILTERTKTGKAVTEEQGIQAITTQKKKLLNAKQQFLDAGREEMAADLETEISLCESLLPKQMSEEEVRKLAAEQIDAVGASAPSDMGKVMGPLMKELKGKADGNLVKKVVMELLK